MARWTFVANLKFAKLHATASLMILNKFERICRYNTPKRIEALVSIIVESAVSVQSNYVLLTILICFFL